MAEPQPLILNDASLKISNDGTVAGLTELACVTNHIELSPDVGLTTLDTMCGSKDYPGTVKWSLIATLYQSFDPDATEDVLSAAVELGVPAPFEIIGYKSQPVGATNPKWTGFVIPQPYAPINGDAGDASEVELEWSVDGEPLKEIIDTFSATATLAELQDQASSRGLSTSGTKAELQARIAEHDAAGA